MIYAGIIKRIREKCPVFEGRVAGTALFQTLSEDDAQDLKMPCGFVVPSHEIADEAANMADNQRVKERFLIIVAVNNSEDRASGLGLIAMDVLRGIRQELIDALMPWEPMPNYDTIRYIGGRNLRMTRSKLWKQFEWQTAYYISPNKNETCEHLKEAYIRAGIAGHPRDGEPYRQFIPMDTGVEIFK